MAKKQKKAKKPQDATLRNVRAANRKIAALEDVVRQSIKVIDVLELRVKNIEGSLAALLELAPTLQGTPKNQD